MQQAWEHKHKWSVRETPGKVRTTRNNGPNNTGNGEAAVKILRLNGYEGNMCLFSERKANTYFVHVPDRKA